MNRFFVLGVVYSLLGCSAEEQENSLFSCVRDAQCIDGYGCHPARGVCVPSSQLATDAGGFDAALDMTVVPAPDMTVVPAPDMTVVPAPDMTVVLAPDAGPIAPRVDTDGDGVWDDDDNCPFHENADQKDSDDSGVGDVCACYLGAVCCDQDRLTRLAPNTPCVAKQILCEAVDPTGCDPQRTAYTGQGTCNRGGWCDPVEGAPLTEDYLVRDCQNAVCTDSNRCQIELDCVEDQQCSGREDWHPCSDGQGREYDICLGQICQSPGCGDAQCNVTGPPFTIRGARARLSLEQMGPTRLLAPQRQWTWRLLPALPASTWDEAVQACDELQPENQAGYHLPTLHELLTLVEPTGPQDLFADLDRASRWAWTSQGHTWRAYKVNLNTGQFVPWETSAVNKVLCLSNTVASRSRLTRFSQTPEGGLIDSWTTLRWSDTRGPATFREAMLDCRSNGWRLPELKELASLIDPSVPFDLWQFATGVFDPLVLGYDIRLWAQRISLPVAAPCGVDSDGDGFGVDDGCVLDCDPEDPAVFPEAPEVPGNGIDDNCDGQTDEPSSDIWSIDFVQGWAEKVVVDEGNSFAWLPMFYRCVIPPGAP